MCVFNCPSDSRGRWLPRVTKLVLIASSQPASCDMSELKSALLQALGGDEVMLGTPAALDQYKRRRALSCSLSRRSKASMQSSAPMTAQNTARRASVFIRCPAACRGHVTAFTNAAAWPQLTTWRSVRSRSRGCLFQ